MPDRPDHIHLHVDPIPKGVFDVLVEIQHRLRTLENKIMGLPESLEALRAEVARNTSVDESAVLAINGLILQVEDLKGRIQSGEDAVAVLDEFTTTLRGSSDGLAAAIPAGTEEPPAEG